jgi:predicted phosphodiesterase
MIIPFCIGKLKKFWSYENKRYFENIKYIYGNSDKERKEIKNKKKWIIKILYEKISIATFILTYFFSIKNDKKMNYSWINYLLIINY